MSEPKPSTIAVATTWVAFTFVVLLLLFGIVRHGWSLEVHRRFWQDIAGRAHGPMTFRFILQPTMAGIAALTDGIRDARLGHRSFFWTAVHDSTKKAGRLREGLTSTARVVLLGLGMDLIYQLKVFDRFYPAEAVMMVILLALLPYFVFRWIVEQLAHRWFARHGSHWPDRR